MIKGKGGRTIKQQENNPPLRSMVVRGANPCGDCPKKHILLDTLPLACYIYYELMKEIYEPHLEDNMKKTTKMLCLFFALLILALPALAQVADSKAKAGKTTPATLKSAASLLQQPRADAAFVQALSEGEEVAVKTMGLSWCQVVAGGKEGYVASALLTFSDAAEGETFAVVSANNGRLTLREKSSTKSKALGKYNNGNIVAVMEKGSPFTLVRVAGKEGYLLTDHLTLTGPRESAGTGVVSWPDNPKRVRNIKFRWADKTGNNVIGNVKTGSEFVLLKQGDDWSEIELEGKVGYMMTQYLLMDTQAAPSKQVADPNQPTQAPSLFGTVVPGIAAPTVAPAAPVQPAQPGQGATQAPAAATPLPKATPAPTREPGEYLTDDDELIPVDFGD